MAAPPAGTHGRVLTAEELELALRMLKEEEQSGRRRVRFLLYSLANYLSFGGLALALPLGALIFFFDRPFGQALLILGGIALLIFIVITIFSQRQITTASIRDAFDLSQESPDSPVESGWRKRSKRTHLFIGLLLFPGCLSVIGGLAWLLYGIFVLNTVIPLSLVLIAWPVLGLFAATALSTYQAYAYFSGVAHLRRDFAARLAAGRSTDETHVPISPEQVSQLADAQQRNIDANVRQAVRQDAERAQELYSAVIEPDVQSALRSLPPETQTAVQDFIDALQFDPRPASAQVSGEGDGLVLHHAGFTLTYRLDDMRQRLTVTGLKTTDDQDRLHVG